LFILVLQKHNVCKTRQMTNKLAHLPKPKFKERQYITDGEGQSFEIRFIEYDFERGEYYYFPIPDTFAGKIYESDARLTNRPMTSSELAYELLFGDKEKAKKERL